MKPHAFDYSRTAELYICSRGRETPRSMAFRRFEVAANAIRYLVEEVPRAEFAGTFMEVDDVRYLHTAIRELYDSSAYPLRRHSWVF